MLDPIPYPVSQEENWELSGRTSREEEIQLQQKGKFSGF
jgi:hypothetical protein